MTTVIIKTNVSQATPVLIKDMGAIIPATGGSDTFSSVKDLDDIRLSKNLRTLTTDNAYGALSSTIILNDGTSNIAQIDVLSYLDFVNVGQPTQATQVTVDFGFPTGPVEGETATVTVAATWVRSTTKFTCTVANDGTDHINEDSAIEGITATVVNVISATSFDVLAYAPEGTWGRYLVNVLAL